MQQENKSEELQWLKRLQPIQNFIQQTHTFLQSFLIKGLRRLNLYRYPLDNYNKVWKSLNQCARKLINAFEINSEKQVLMSTVIYWIMPHLAAAYNDIFIFIKNYSQKRGEQPQIAIADITEVYQQFKLQDHFSFTQIALEHILRVPFLFLKQFMNQMNDLNAELQERVVIYDSQANDSCVQPDRYRYLRKKYNILHVENKELKNALSQMSNILQFLNKEDEFVNRENSVIKYNIILKQYNQVPKKRSIMKFVYRIKLISKWKKLEKKIKERLYERKMNILQLIDGQEKYIKGLAEYIDNVKEPIQKLNILDEYQLRKLFSSISQIKQFHINMESKLKQEYKQYSDSQQYGSILQKFIPFFKLYTDYILNADSAQKLLMELSANNKEIGQICKLYVDKTSKVAYNELLQPTFRIARYQTLFSQIIKKTSKSHPDYKQLIDAQANFKKILTQVNDQVDKIIRRNRLNQLEKEFGTQEFSIYKEKREYLDQFSLTLIKEPKPEQVILIVFTDLLLIIDELTRKISKKIVINQDFFPRRQEDSKIYRNMITIHSDGFMTFTTGTEQLNANKAQQVYQVLRKITKDTGQLVYVAVLGTQQIGSTSFAKYTQYIVQVRYLDLKKLLHLRFSSISDLVTEMQRHYKNNLKITQEDSLRKNWFNSHKSKTIQARKLIIAQIFQKLFNHQLIKNEPKFFLDFLNLPQNFYKVARTSYEKRLSMGQSMTVSGLKRSYLTKKQQKQAFTILCGTEIKLGRDLFHDIQNDEQVKKLKQNAKKIQIVVQTFNQQDPTLIQITDYDSVEDVCNKVSKLIGLRSNRDFRLFHQIGKKQLRVLEHEQLMSKIFSFPDKEEQNEAFNIKQLFKSAVKFISPQNFPTLIFKKYYYLPFDIEQAQVRKDLTRLRLIVFQVFSEIRDMKYQLTFDEYLLFLAMMIYIKIDGKLQNAPSVDYSIVSKIIPQTVYKLKNYSEKEWIQKCQHHLVRIHQQIQKVIAFNHQQLRHNKIRADTASKTSLYFGHRHLCSQIVLNKIKTNPIFGSNIFYVQPHSSCYNKLLAKGKKVSYNMWLAIKVQSLYLLTPSAKEEVVQIKYKDIFKIQVYSQSIVLKLQGVIEEQFRLNTYQSFEISQLVKYNQALNQILNNLKQDSTLNSKVKQYRDQLIQYRTTCEGDHTGLSMIR